MIASRKQRTTDNGQRTPRAAARGFTMIELLIVIIVIAILVGLLLPAINAAIRAAKNAAVSAEISQLAQGLENFKNKYGSYPPSRVILYENGLFPVNDGTFIQGENITNGALSAQTLSALRQFFPKVAFSTSGLPAPVLAGQQSGNPYWYDFNGNGTFDQGAYVLHGHECLVFFLGGIPLLDPKSSTYGLTGFGQDPTNPFTNSVLGSNMWSPNRQPPIFEFNPGRLFIDPSNNTANGLLPAGVPGYYDSFGNSPPGSGTTLNFYAYFSAYGNGNYNPDDVNFYTEDDGGNNATQAPLAPVWLNYQRTGITSIATPFSAVPNPYTSTQTANVPPGALPTGTITFQKGQTFQIISSGVDGQYGVGGQFVASTSASSTASNPLPFDQGNTGAGPGPPLSSPAQAESGPTIRLRENDNLTNFKSGTLQ